MFQFKTLFGRLLFTYVIIAIVMILLLGILTTQILRETSTNEERENLKQVTKMVNVLFEESVQSKDSGEDLHRNVSRMATFDRSDIWIVDRFGTVLYKFMGSEDLQDNQEMLLQNKEVLFSQVIAGKTDEMLRYEENIYTTPIITMGAPLSIDGEINGAVFVHAKLSRLENSLNVFYSQLLTSASISAILAFMLIYFTSRRIERPLYEINVAAKEFAKGHFDKRIHLTDNTEIGELVSSFNSMAEELEKYEGTRTSFVANVSHELKSPLTSIQGFVQGIQDGTIAKEDQSQYLDIVLSETKHLNILIEDLLDLAKIESGQFPLHMKEWDINEMLRRTLLSFITKIEEKNLEVVVNIKEQKTIVIADEDRIHQVISNLLDNAVKFAEPGGTIKIWTNEANEKVQVSIANTGQVIPERDIPFVFDRFFKVDRSHNRRAKGTGIGLSIVKNIVLQHGEQIWVNSKEGTETVFTFTLKLKKESKKG